MSKKKKPEEDGPIVVPSKKVKLVKNKDINLKISNPNHAELGLRVYRTILHPTPQGLVLIHEGIVEAKGCDADLMEFMFEIPADHQDDLGFIERRWKTTIDAIRLEYAAKGLFVTMDIRIPMTVVKSMQGMTPQKVKDAINDNSAPADVEKFTL